MTTTQLRSEIRETRNSKLDETKEIFEMGFITSQERFSRDYESYSTFKKEMSFTK